MIGRNRKDPTLWALLPHSKAKHEILRRYLQAWLPILGNRPALYLIDGFAGPGRYTGGDEGSPLIMVRALLEHTALARITAHVRFFFIEERRDRVAHLIHELEAFEARRPSNVTWSVVPGDYAGVMRALLSTVTPPKRLPPTFLFLDPFGYAETRLTLTTQVLTHRSCEVLVYVPFPFLARFLDEPAVADAFTNLYGDERWRAAEGKHGRERVQELHDQYRDVLRQSAAFVRSFEVATASGSGYHLFFASNHLRGFERMKEAMWHVDPEGGEVFRDSTQRDQMLLFEREPDGELLARQLHERFGGRGWIPIRTIETHTVVATTFLRSHVRRLVLIPGEQDGSIEVRRERGKARDYPAGTMLRFRAVARGN